MAGSRSRQKDPTPIAHARGAVALLAAGFDRITARVHEFHRAISDIPFDRLAPLPGVNAGSEGARVVHDGVTDTVYGVIRAAGSVLFRAAGSALKAVERDLPLAPAAPHRVRDDVVSAVSGVVGDYMARSRNPLAIPLALHHRGERLPLTRAAFEEAYPDAGGRLAIFLHGLCCNENCWRLYVDEADPQTAPYSDRLAAELGFTPLFVRYNSGLHVSQNGRAMARLLGRLAGAWPCPIEEIAFIGHSMGGLVARSACHAGARRNAGWTRLVSHVVCLGTPHLGAPLEKAVHVATALLEAFPLGRPWADALKSRSVGIKDLRWGYVGDEHWRGRDLDALLENGRTPIPRLPHVRYHFLGSTLSGDPGNLLGRALGDGMVRLDSSTARDLADADTAVLTRVGHMRLLNHPAVYDEIRSRLARDAAA